MDPIANVHIGNWEFEDTVRFLGQILPLPSFFTMNGCEHCS